MQFRWLALITLWTIISGPIFSGPGAKGNARPAIVKSPACFTPENSVKP